MANKKISDFTAATSAASGDLIEIETAGGNSRKITKANFQSGLPALLEEHVFASAAANHTFTGFSSAYRDLIVVVRGRGTTAATITTVQFVFNADTGTNYDRQQTTISTSVTGTTNTFGSTAGVVGDIPASSASSGSAGLTEVRIGDYRGTIFHKVSNGRSQYKTGTSAGNYVTVFHSMTWRSTSAITSILVQLGAGNFDAGSVVSLYGAP